MTVTEKRTVAATTPPADVRRFGDGGGGEDAVAGVEELEGLGDFLCGGAEGGLAGGLAVEEGILEDGDGDGRFAVADGGVGGFVGEGDGADDDAEEGAGDFLLDFGDDVALLLLEDGQALEEGDFAHAAGEGGLEVLEVHRRPAASSMVLRVSGVRPPVLADLTAFWTASRRFSAASNFSRRRASSRSFWRRAAMAEAAPA